MNKKFLKKLKASAVSAVMAVSCLSSVFTANAGNTYFSSDFDSGSDGWSARGVAVLSGNNENYYDGGGSLFVSNRLENWHGAEIPLSENMFRAGETYSFSAAVLQKSGSSLNMKMTLQYTSNGMEQFDSIALVTADSDVWTDISNTEYTIPFGAENMKLYIESPESLTDFYIDKFTAAEKYTESYVVTGKGTVDGKGTENPQPQGNSSKGDLNGDGVIDVFDMIIARDLVVKMFSGSSGGIDLSVADMDGNGSFAVNDVVLLSKYILGETDSFPQAEIVTTTTAPPDITPATTTTIAEVPNGDGNYMSEVEGKLEINAPSSFTQNKAGVDYGKMELVTYYSKDGGIDKKMNVLLPAGYNTNEKYPVLYVLHGIFGDETSMPGMGIQTMVGNLIADGEAEKMIVVFPAMFTGSGAPGFTAESSRKYDLIREDIENSIMPYLEEHYSVKTGRENTAVTGFSMGGREALYTGVTRSEVYGYVGAACPAPGIFETTDNYMHHEGCLTQGEFKPSVSPELLLISAAAFDGTVGNYPESYHNALAQNGVQHLWQIIPNGDHGGATVTPHMYNFLRLIFKA